MLWVCVWGRGEDLREGASLPATSYAVLELSLPGLPSESSASPPPFKGCSPREKCGAGVTGVSGSPCFIQRKAGYAATPGSVSETQRTWEKPGTSHRLVRALYTVQTAIAGHLGAVPDTFAGPCESLVHAFHSGLAKAPYQPTGIPRDKQR